MGSRLQLCFGLSYMSMLLPCVWSTDYCNKKCSNGVPSILCTILLDGPSADCQGFSCHDMNSSDLTYILDYHNIRRNSLAGGQFQDYPSASDMTELVWDDELAIIARRWLYQCTFGIPKCCASSVFTDVKMNIAQGEFDLLSGPNMVYVASRPILQTMLEYWFNSMKNFPVSEITNMSSSAASTDVASMMWSRTSNLGCSLTQQYLGNFNYKYMLACNYAPSGIQLMSGNLLYQKGKPKSQCRDKTGTTHYPNLCPSKQSTTKFGDSSSNAADSRLDLRPLHLMIVAVSMRLFFLN